MMFEKTQIWFRQITFLNAEIGKLTTCNKGQWNKVQYFRKEKGIFPWCDQSPYPGCNRVIEDFLFYLRWQKLSTLLFNLSTPPASIARLFAEVSKGWSQFCQCTSIWLEVFKSWMAYLREIGFCSWMKAVPFWKVKDLVSCDCSKSSWKCVWSVFSYLWGDCPPIRQHSKQTAKE